jgi:hypothetical protein
MPFDKGVKIELCYRNGGDQKKLNCHFGVEYSNEKRNPEKEGKLYTCWRMNKFGEEKSLHVMLDTKGKGHYIATLLQAQGKRPGMTTFFEGDDSTAVDGEGVIHGTGSEDYFNGGWYACPDRWDTRKGFPMHGALDYSLPFSRTGGYRFFLADKISFDREIFQSIEHGTSAYGLPVDYTSLSFYYCSRSPSEVQQPTHELSTVYMADTLMLYPQLMEYTVWGSINLESVGTNYHTGGNSCRYTVTNESRLKISLAGVPSADYQLYGDFTKSPTGCKFKVWQGQREVSDWIEGFAHFNAREEMMPFCKVHVGGQDQSLTLTFKVGSETNQLFLNRLILVKDHHIE